MVTRPERSPLLDPEKNPGLPKSAQQTTPPAKPAPIKTPSSDDATGVALPTPEEIVLSWTTPEYIAHERSTTWFIVVAAVFVLLIGGAIFFGSPLTAILFALIGVVIFLFASRTPGDVDVMFTDDGMFINERYYAFTEFQSFWIFYEEDNQELSIRTNRPVASMVRVQIGDIDPVDLRNLLLQYAEEIEQDESIADVLARRLKI